MFAAVEAECRRRQQRFAEGVERYRRFARPYREPAYEIAWRNGSTRLRDYGGDGLPLLIVPSLVNRCTVLDLDHGRSFVQALKRRGVRPLLVDWDAPGPGETDYDISDYVVQRLEPALDRAIEINGGKPVIVAGYCMGGCLALALAQRQPEQIGGLALLATPWDFHAANHAQRDMLEATLPMLEPMLETLGELPVDIMQAFFAGLDPWLTPEKFIRFAGLDAASADAQLFVALEDWLNDGVPLTVPVARECLRGWYVDNLTARGAWRIAGEAIRPESVGCPAIAFVPGRDHIVPPPSARALAEGLPNCDLRAVPAGHIGMVAGARAEEVLIDPLAAWATDLESAGRRSR